MTASIVSLGSINADFQVRVNDNSLDAGLLLGSSMLRVSGGKAANVAIVAKRLGSDAHLIGRVGNDDLANQALAGPSAENVDLDGVRTVDGPTGVAVILVPPNGDKTIVLVPNANMASDDSAIESRHIATAPRGSILVADFEIPARDVRAAMNAATERDVTVIVDPSPADHVPSDLFHQIGHITPNGSEARQLTSIDTNTADGALAAATELVARGIGVAYVKLRHGGCAVATGTVREIITAPADITVVDTTGAGDAFAGALAHALLAGHGPVDAAAIAVAGSACAVTRYGSQASYPTPPELAAMTARVNEVTHQQ